MKLLDMLGNPCPIPVLTAKKELALEETSGVIVLVDNFVAIQNLEKMSKGIGYEFHHDEAENGNFRAIITKNGVTYVEESPKTQTPTAVMPTTGATVLIGRNQMGQGSEELGKMLIKGFIFSLTQLNPLPKSVYFFNSGIDLVCEGSNTVEDLKNLAAQGCNIFACGTCLNYYNRSADLAVGEICDMFAITSGMNEAHPLISI